MKFNQAIGDRSKNMLKNKDSFKRLGRHQVLIFIMSIAVLACISWIYAGTSDGASVSVISDGDEWQYFKGIEEPPFKWSYLSYDASAWLQGRTGFGYGPGAFRTFLGDMKGSYETVYVRRDFIINSPVKVKTMNLFIGCDGPFTAFINGIEVISNSEPVNEELDISGFADMLRSGRNVLAVQCTNDDLNSDNFSFTAIFKVDEY